MKRVNPLLIFLLCLISCNQPEDAKNRIIEQSKVGDPVTFYTQGQLDQVLKLNLDSAIHANRTPLMANYILGLSKDSAPYMVVVRAAPGSVEIHELWDDVAIIRSGHGILKTGYQVTGEQQEVKGPSTEWTGGTIRDGKERIISPGDFIIIPALLAHQYIPNPGDTLTYWTIKVKRTK